MSTAESLRTVVFDLDATAAVYEGWDTHGSFPGPPREDFLEAVKILREYGRHIGILSTRPDRIVNEWIDKHGLGDVIDFVGESPWQPPNTGYKPIAFCYVDDRAVRYNGRNMRQIVDSILNGALEPWYRVKEQHEWVNLDHRKLRNVGGGGLVRHVYGYHGQLWPRLTLSAYSHNGDLIFSVDTKQDTKSWWEKANLPVELVDDYASMVLEAKTELAKATRSIEDDLTVIMKRHGFTEAFWINYPTWQLSLCEGERREDIRYFAFNTIPAPEDTYGVKLLFQKISPEGCLPVLPDGWSFRLSE